LIKKDYGMGRYYYPDATNALDAKIQFLREHHYKIRHCFKNDGRKGYVLFDTRVDVNEWYKETYGKIFYKDERENGRL
jgi:hypothetical protein